MVARTHGDPDNVLVHDFFLMPCFFIFNQVEIPIVDNLDKIRWEHLDTRLKRHDLYMQEIVLFSCWVSA
jgi:hypothetical protein